MKKGRKILAFLLALAMIINPLLPQMTVTVQAARTSVKRIELKNCNTNQLTLVVGKSYQLKSKAVPSKGPNKKIIYKSSKKSVARVNKKGKITAKKTGTAIVTVMSAANKRVKQKIRVKVVRESGFKSITQIRLSASPKKLAVGKSVKVKCKINPGTASNKNLTWKSNKPSVAAVNYKGVVTAKKPGTVTITAMANDGSKKKGKIKIKVKPVKVKRVTVSPSKATIMIGETKKLTAAVAPAKASKKAVKWSSSNKAVAKVDGGGLVTAVGKGTAVIRAAATDGSGKYGTCVFTVRHPGYDITFAYVEGDPVTVHLKDGEKLTEPKIPTCEYATFEGWYYGRNELQRYDFASPVTESFTLYAKWIYDDKNANGIEDYLEAYYGIDGEGRADREDYDGDGITDYDEINYTKTDPSKADSDGNGVPDGDEDTDGDGIINREEYRYTTSLAKADTDGDGLSDGDEVFVYQTDPLKDDSDGDSIVDGDEIELGLDPLSGCTNGITPDAERVFAAELSEENIAAELLEEENLMIPAMSTKGAPGIYNDHVTVEASADTSYTDNRAVVGSAIVVSSDYENLNSTLTFSFAPEKYSQEDANYFVICKSTEDGDYEPLESVLDYANGTVSASISADGVYFVLRVDEFLNVLGIDIEAALSNHLTAQIPPETQTLLPGASVRGELSGTQVDYYSFVPEETDVYTFYTADHMQDVITLLYDGDGTILGQTESGYAEITQELSAGEIYYFAVANKYALRSGEYTIGMLQRENGAAIPKNPEPIALKEMITTDIAVGGTIAYYVYVPEESGIYSFSSSTEKDTMGIILSAEGEQLSSDDDSKNGSDFLISYRLEAGETYYLGAMFYSETETGELNVYLERGVPREDFEAVSLNGLSNWNRIKISASEEEAVYFSFIPERSGVYTMYSKGSGDPYVEVWDEDKYSIAFSDDDMDAHFSVSCELQAGKIYYYKIGFYSVDGDDVTVTFFEGEPEETAALAVSDERDLKKKDAQINTNPQMRKHAGCTLDSRLEKTELMVLSQAVQEERVKAPSGIKGQADIVFAIDTTGSMDDAINNVASNVNQFVTTLVENYNVQINFALIEFRDIEEDGPNSTRVIKNGTSNWFSNVADFKEKVNEMTVDGGGDTPESAIDALETARRLNFRSGAEKYVILISDADYKIANNYGLKSMNEEIQKLLADDINVSVISAFSDRGTYEELYKKTGGIWADIYGDFAQELLKIADMIGEDVSSGTWVLLRGYQYVKLKGEVSPDNKLDTDGDGISDYKELGTLVERSVDRMIRLYLQSMDISPEFYKGGSTVSYYDYKTNPVLKDTDYDGIDDGQDPKPNSNTFNLTFHNHYEKDIIESSVKVKMDYGWFFDSNTAYNKELGRLSLLYAAAIYSDPNMDGNSSEFGRNKMLSAMKAADMMKAFGMSSVKTTKLKDTYFDQHLSEVSMGHRKVTCDGQTKEVIQIVVRGTNGTLEEWESNFDVGTTVDYKKKTEWTHKNNHMGFDITANRIMRLIQAYVKNYVDSSVDQVYWITGHSRGAGIANILGADLIDAGNKVFAYTYASPNTTTVSNAGDYTGIYNLVNQDDFVPMLPLTKWDFGLYGKTAVLDISKSLEKEWESFTGIWDYNPDTYGLDETVAELGSLASGRNELYEFPGGSDYQVVNKLKKKTTGEANSEIAKARAVLPINFDRSGGSKPLYYMNIYRWVDYGLFSNKTYYGYIMEQSPAYFMQILAGVMSGTYSKFDFAFGKNMAKAFSDAKGKLIGSTFGGVEHPHYTESYYIISNHVKGADFK